MRRVMVISEDDAMKSELAERLAEDGYETELESDLSNIEFHARLTEFELAVVDMRKDYESGFRICEVLKRAHPVDGVRVIGILPQRDEDRVIHAFQVGIDDCVFDPVRVKELGARIKAVLRRGFPRPLMGRTTRVIRIDPLEIHHDEFKAYLSGSPMDLTRSEFIILHALASHPKRVYSRKQLLDYCGNLKGESKGRSVDVHVRSLRQKMGHHAEMIQTSRGVGYFLDQDSSHRATS